MMLEQLTLEQAATKKKRDHQLTMAIQGWNETDKAFLQHTCFKAWSDDLTQGVIAAVRLKRKLREVEEVEQEKEDRKKKKLRDAEEMDQANQNETLESRPVSDPKGVIVLVSAPETTRTGQDVLVQATAFMRETHEQLVAAGYAQDLLNSQLPKGEWRDAWLGKLDGYLRVCSAANRPVHCVTIRGGRMCNWERKILEEEFGSGKLLSGISHLTHFPVWEDLKNWIEAHSSNLFCVDLTSMKEAAEAQVMQKNIDIARIEERLRSVHAENQGDINRLRAEMEARKEEVVQAQQQMQDFGNLAQHELQQRIDRLQVFQQRAKESAESAQVADKAASQVAELMKKVARQMAILAEEAGEGHDF